MDTLGAIIVVMVLICRAVRRTPRTSWRQDPTRACQRPAHSRKVQPIPLPERCTDETDHSSVLAFHCRAPARCRTERRMQPGTGDRPQGRRWRRARGRLDRQGRPGRGGATNSIDDAKFVAEGKNFHVTTGPAVDVLESGEQGERQLHREGDVHGTEVHEPQRSSASVRHRDRRQRHGHAISRAICTARRTATATSSSAASARRRSR